MTALAWVITLMVPGCAGLVAVIIVQAWHHHREIRAERALQQATVGEAVAWKREALAYHQVIHGHVDRCASRWANRLWEDSR